MSESEHCFIRSINREHRAKVINFMACLLNDPGNSVRDILVEKENHLPASAI